MKKFCLTSCLSILLCINLTGCGQTGPLYLPDNPPKKSSTTGQ